MAKLRVYALQFPLFAASAMSITDEKYMKRCLLLASLAGGYAAPNPLVGCVIVKNDQIIGEGFHRGYGGPHAEVEAVRSVGSASAIQGSIIYVSLEPCSHYGKTPPCANLLISLGPEKVVVAQKDPYPEVSGRGIDLLLKSGIKVETGILEHEARHLNRKFNALHERGRPWITLKWAQSADGFIGPLINSEPKEYQRNRQISGLEAARFVHRLRAENMAILVGYRTWELDQPSLNTRYWPGPSPQIFLISQKNDHTDDFKTKNIQLAKNPEDALEKMAKAGIHSVLVEGGSITLESFISKNLWDEAFVIKTQKVLNEGTKAQTISGKFMASFALGHDIIEHFSSQSI